MLDREGKAIADWSVQCTNKFLYKFSSAFVLGGGGAEGVAGGG